MKGKSIFTSLLAAIAMGASSPTSFLTSKGNFRGATPSRRIRDSAKGKKAKDCIQSSKADGLPRGYPGAKLARKAAMKAVGVRHSRGLRLDGVTV